MFLRRQILFSLPLILVWAPLAVSQQLAELRRQFELQEGAVRRAQFFSKKLGPAEVLAIADLYHSGSLEAANSRAGAYVEQVAILSQELMRAVPDPERHSGGFKQLEIHLRQATSKFRDVAASLPFSERDELNKQIDRLERLRSDIFSRLFPRTPKRQQKKPR